MGIFFLTHVSTENKVPAIFLMRVILELGENYFFQIPAICLITFADLKIL
jgi:hypothetical protein